jgi:arylsulfatase A-like enzyme
VARAAQGAGGRAQCVLILIDDVGFGATSAFGGPISTPNFERLANAGLRYNSFHMNALCSPTRAALLTGRNNHQVGFGSIAEWSAPYPGYSTVLPKSAATIAEVLKENGYSTSAYGKWHNTPMWEVSPAGPFNRWPTGLGFEHFYGFNQAADDQYYPRIYNDTTPVEPSKSPKDGYHFTTDITDNAIGWLHQHDAVAHDKPFFIYFATGATHEPHQVPKQWVDHYRGRFDRGWDVIRKEAFEQQKAHGVIPANAEFTPRPDGCRRGTRSMSSRRNCWRIRRRSTRATPSRPTTKLAACSMRSAKKGRRITQSSSGSFGDNGASAEGGLEGHDARDVERQEQNHRSALRHRGVARQRTLHEPLRGFVGMGVSTRRLVGTKQDAGHLGGTTDPLVVNWPGHIKSGVRGQFSHVNDIASTIYDIVGIKLPDEVDGVKQIPLEGKSLVYTFDTSRCAHAPHSCSTSRQAAIAPSTRMAGGRVTASTPHGSRTSIRELSPTRIIDAHPWELYNLNDDFSQAHNLADKHPEKLKELSQGFDEEATRNHAYPILPGSFLAARRNS